MGCVNRQDCTGHWPTLTRSLTTDSQGTTSQSKQEKKNDVTSANMKYVSGSLCVCIPDFK